MAKNYGAMSDAELRKLAAQNSANWHTSDAATKDALHQQNVEINKILDSRTGSTSTFDSGSGKWSTAGGSKPSSAAPRQSTGGGSTGRTAASSGGSTGGGTKESGLPYGLDDYGQTDWSVLLKDAMGAGAGADEVQRLLNSRVDKALNTPGLGQYAYDDTYRAAMDYINMMQQQAAFNQSPVYNGRYDDEADSIKDQITKMTYEDWINSDAYRSLAARYGHLAGIGMDDVLGKLAARTGGLASSYAVSAAQQQYNEYMGRLEEVARQMYDADRGDLMENFGLLQDLDQRDYNRFLGSLSQYNTDRNFQYQAGLDRWKQDYQTGRDQITDQRYDQEYADSRQDAAQKDAKDRIDAFLATGGSSAELDPDLVERSGYSQVELAALERYYAQHAQQAAGKGGSSGGRGSGSGSGSAGGSGAGNEGIYQSLYDSGARSEGDAHAWLLASGYNTTQAGKLAGYFSDWMNKQGSIQGVGGGSGGDTGGFTFNQIDRDPFKGSMLGMIGGKTPNPDRNEQKDTGSSSSTAQTSNYVRPSEMGMKALQLYGQISTQAKFDPSAGERIADEIEAAMKNGSITEAEASTLLGMMGY